ncbi:MAG: EAL domain-containing protein [Cyanobacteria bacterium P01_D01_bin.36]
MCSHQLRLQEAIENQEFELYFQPIVDLRTGKSGSCEALARWPKKDGEIAYPDEFIPMAEETGMMLGLCSLITDLAVAQAIQWSTNPEMSTIKIDVNLSAITLQHLAFIECLVRKIKDSSIDASIIAFEVTETFPLPLGSQTIKIFQVLREAGHEVALDDLGTGNNGLSNLMRILKPASSINLISGIKIDKFFIDRLNEPDTRSVVELFVAIAKRNALAVVAEGVEKKWQVKALREIGVGYGQGWYWAKAMRVEEFEEWIQVHPKPLNTLA